MEAVENLMTLARSRDPADRARLLDAVVALCQEFDSHGRSLPTPIRQTLEAIFLGIVNDAERDIRKRLAEKLSDAAWAPQALVNVLVLDEIEIAGPLIAASPVLKDSDLIEILVKATLEHQLAVARRPSLAAPVVEAIIDTGDPAVLTALAGNDTAHIAPDAMQRLVAHARDVAALRSPLARHPRLSGELAERLYEWVGQSLRTALVSRFRIDEAALDKAIRQSSQEASQGAVKWSAHNGHHSPQPCETERALIGKLHAAGQLRPGYLMRALRENRLNLFIEALAALGNFQSDHIRQAINSDRPELLALACVAVGIDRGAFPAMLQLVRTNNHNRPGGGEEGLRRATGAFGPFDGDAAGNAFTRALNASA